MKLVFTLCIACCIGMCSCQGQQNQLDNRKQYMAVPISLQNDNLIAGAFIFPDQWTIQSESQLVHTYGWQTLNHIRGSRNDGQMKFRFDDLGTGAFNATNAQMMQYMGVPSNNPYERPYPGIQAYTNESILPLIHESYKITDQQFIENFISPMPGQSVETLLTAYVSESNPDRIAFLFSFGYVFQPQQQFQFWNTSAAFFEGSIQESDEMYNLAKLMVKTWQANPVLIQFIDNLNQKKMIAGQNNFNQIMKAARQNNDQFYANLHEVQNQSNSAFQSTSEQFSDMMLDVQTYVNPNTGKQYKMPSANTYYFEGNAGEFIGSNNPLFDPNNGLNSLYNWQQLSKK